ncbi:MAG: DNA recombination protein RmuC [Bacteroidales bacterium]|nr:DNA recombination protein RmuC [Bacteroidales bacterium]MDY0198942.1 DNA recombination protein RmuC [Tenuifilaceae bacterium]
MFELISFSAIGLIVGAIIAFIIIRMLRGSLSSQVSGGTPQNINELESDLRIANDRLERALDDKNQIAQEFEALAKEKGEQASKLSSLVTLNEEIRKQIITLTEENKATKDEQKQVIETYQEQSRKLSATEEKANSLKQQVDSFIKETEVLKDERKQLQTQLSESRERTVELDKENKYLKEMLENQKGEVEDIGKKFSNEFKLLADAILEDKSKRFTALNQANIEQLLKPLGENILVFQKKVEEVYDRESKERFSLGKEVEKLVTLNQKISEEANNLTNALKGQVKQQGNWGEMILESILERSGLVKDREYFVQESFKDEEGRRFQPDVIIKYPDNRKVVIDSKVSLVAYERYCSSENPDEQKKELASHVKSIRNHIDILSSKGYQDLVGDLDFVTMFLPVEPAFIVAMQSDPEIWNYAYAKNVLLLSPTNLIAALKLIHNLWQHEYQNKNALEIADRGGKLYDKFVSFVESLSSVGDNLIKSQNSFDTAMKQLTSGSGNLVSQAQKIKELGAKAKKTMPNQILDAADEELITKNALE